MIAALLLVGMRPMLQPPAISDTLEPFSLTRSDHQPYAWQPCRTTVLSFCAFWCDTWKDQLPRVKEAAKALGGLPIDFLTISVDGRWTERSQAVAVGTMLADPAGEWSRSLGIDRVPYTLVVNQNGRIVWTSYGTVRSQELLKAARQSLAPTSTQGTIYLTFDDFPSERLSDQLLDLLRKESVPATFFCIGTNASEWPRITRRAVQEGHELEIHAWNHESKNPEVGKCATFLRTIGAHPHFLRAPGSEVIQSLTGQPFQAPTVDPYDYQRPGKDELTRRILSQVRPSCVLQLHAGVSDTLEALPGILASLRRRGFVFQRLQDR